MDGDNNDAMEKKCQSQGTMKRSAQFVTHFFLDVPSNERSCCRAFCVDVL